MANTSFAISPTTVTQTCGTIVPQTFTATGTSVPQGATVSYTWNIGANSGWNYNRSAAPSTISTGASNTLTLTPVCGKALSSIAATATVNGTAYNTNSVAVQIIQPSLSINGTANLCSGSSNYFVNNLPCNANITWSLSPSSGVVNPSCLSCNQTTLTWQSAGTVTLSANITNACGLTVAPITKTISTNPNTVITGNYQLASNGIWIDHGPLNNSGYPQSIYVSPAQTVEYGITLTNTGLTGVSWSVSGACSNVTSDPTSFYCVIPAPGTGASGVTVNLHATGPCGTAINNNYSVAVYPNSYMMVSPNPATNSVKVMLSNAIRQNNGTADRAKNAAQQRGITEIKIYDNMGNLKKVQKGNNTRQAGVSLAGLHSGIYIIEVSDGTFKERQQLIIQQ